ncbi:MAG: DMT family transporter [Bryobacterales bacterium]|nr:DMT family transporter [Bryobacterales bacterium]
MSERARAELALLAVTLVWGASFTLVKAALGDASTVLFLALRFTVATALLTLFARRALATGLMMDPLAWQGGWRAGLCLAAAYLCQTGGLRYTTPAKSAFITSLCTVLVPFFAAAVYLTKPQRNEIPGVAVAMLGMGLLTIPGAEASFGRGEWLTLAGAAAFAAHIVVTGHYAGRAGVNAFSLLQLGAASLIFLAALPWFEPVRLNATPRLLSALAVTAVLCTAVAFTVQAWAQRHTTPTRAGLIFATEPVSAAATSWLAAGETLPPLGWAGAALVLAGVVAVDLKPAPPQRHPQS